MVEVWIAGHVVRQVRLTGSAEEQIGEAFGAWDVELEMAEVHDFLHGKRHPAGDGIPNRGRPRVSVDVHRVRRASAAFDLGQRELVVVAVRVVRRRRLGLDTGSIVVHDLVGQRNPEFDLVHVPGHGEHRHVGGEEHLGAEHDEAVDTRGVDDRLSAHDPSTASSALREGEKK